VDGEFARGLAAGRKAALELDRRIRADSRFVPFAHQPQLDIVVWQMRGASLAESSSRAQCLFDNCSTRNLHLALVQLPAAMFADEQSNETVTCLRSVLMKPEHETWLNEICERLISAIDSGTE
jgi:hypothetical protein